MHWFVSYMVLLVAAGGIAVALVRSQGEVGRLSRLQGDTLRRQLAAEERAREAEQECRRLRRAARMTERDQRIRVERRREFMGVLEGAIHELERTPTRSFPRRLSVRDGLRAVQGELRAEERRAVEIIEEIERQLASAPDA